MIKLLNELQMVDFEIESEELAGNLCSLLDVIIFNSPYRYNRFMKVLNESKSDLTQIDFKLLKLLAIQKFRDEREM